MPPVFTRPLGVAPNTGVLAKLNSFIGGVNLWFQQGKIGGDDRDDLIDDANRIILCINLSNNEPSGG